MITDGRTSEPGCTIETDVCIVGAGAAGLTLALQFLDTGTSVALVESGGIEWNERTQDLADFAVEGPRYFPPRETHIRVFGGTTHAWGGFCMQYDPMDFEVRPWVPNSGWPISFNDVEPYYDHALRLAEASSMADKPEADSADSCEVRWKKVYTSAPARFGQLYRSAFQKSENIIVLLHSTAAELELHPDGRKVDGVRLDCRKGGSFRVKARRYVLAGGGIDNPRLLLLSNRIAGAGIGNSYDVVGRYAMEHPRVTDRYQLSVRTSALAAHIPSVKGKRHFSRLQLTEGAQKGESLLNYQANLYFGYVGQDTDQWMAVRRIAYSVRNFSSPFFPDINGGRNVLKWTDVKTVLRRPDRSFALVAGAAFCPARLRRWVEVMSTVEQPPSPQNRVVLSDEQDELGNPLPKLIWSISDHERYTYRKGLEHVLHKLETLEPGISTARMDDPDPWPDRVIGTWHHMGTTRMHEDPRYGVVDSNCRVHGVSNLFIAGSSVFSTGGVHSPTLTLMALTLRLADHLKTLPDASVAARVWSDSSLQRRGKTRRSSKPQP